MDIQTPRLGSSIVNLFLCNSAVLVVFVRKSKVKLL